MKCFIVNFPLSSMSDIRNISEATEFNSKAYAFLCPFTPPIDSICIVETRNGLAFGKVVRETEITSVANRFILGTLDIEQLKTGIKWYEDQAALIRRINARVNDLTMQSKLAALAAGDPELAAMLEERKRLNGVKPMLTANTSTSNQPETPPSAE